ncbi:MAG TPA: Lrp/AsnC family transcriptional regulator [Thermoplasmata archaeon]|nr:Lrp/AsnC family transcriptional regulator [Thermoplasmata archaeon]
MEDEGFIKYYQVAPDLTLLGMGVESACRFEAVNLATKVAALRAAETLPGMVEALDFLGPSFVVEIAGPSLERAIEVHRSLAHRFELDRFEQGRRELSQCDARLSVLDWRIVERMRFDAHAPLREVAGELGITPRMVRYRLNKMHSSRAVSIRPIIDSRTLRGLILYRLALTFDPARQQEILEDLRRHLGGSIWATRLSLAGPLLVDMFGSSIADPEDAALRSLEVPGVKACRALVLKEVREPARGTWVDLKISELASGRGPLKVAPPGS